VACIGGISNGEIGESEKSMAGGRHGGNSGGSKA